MVLASGISFLSVILFIVSLGVLVTIHELGHFSMAKLFKVYCMEFSIGFGPAIFSKKRKKGETAFSLRCIPLGGYVSMYGEGVELPEGVEIPRERSLLGIKKWKRAIIMSAGIILNFVLGYVLFACNNIFFPQIVATNRMEVIGPNEEGLSTLAYDAGIEDLSAIYSVTWQYLPDGSISEDFPEITNKEFTNFDVLWGSFMIPQDYFKNIQGSDQLRLTIGYFTPETLENETITEEMLKKVDFTIQPKANVNPETNETYYMWPSIVEQDGFEYRSPYLGIESHTYKFRYGFGKALVVSFEDWGDGATAIVKALGGLFVGKGYENVGGPVAILSQSSQVLNNMGFGYYLKLWGLISVNLGLFNLLPFPGLDGWHLLVVAIEGIFRKEIPNKVKNIISTIGMVLLFGLMIVVLIKDVIGLF